LTEQLATPTAPVPANVQLAGENTPVEFEANPTDPLAVIAVPTSLSVTVARQPVTVLFVAGLGEQETLVEDVRLPTATVAVPELVRWLESPP
jgi:hypothetical protein